MHILIEFWLSQNKMLSFLTFYSKLYTVIKPQEYDLFFPILINSWKAFTPFNFQSQWMEPKHQEYVRITVDKYM